MNANFFHNLLNVVGLILGSLVLVDWTGLGLSPAAAATFAGGILVAQNVVKLAMNVFRDGLGGLFKVQPPVQ